MLKVVGVTLILPLLGHESGITSVCFSADGKKVLSGSKDRTVKIWDAHTGQIVETLEGEEYTLIFCYLLTEVNFIYNLLSCLLVSKQNQYNDIHTN